MWWGCQGCPPLSGEGQCSGDGHGRSLPHLLQVQGGSHKGGVAPHQPVGGPWAPDGENGHCPDVSLLAVGGGAGCEPSLAVLLGLGGGPARGGGCICSPVSGGKGRHQPSIFMLGACFLLDFLSSHGTIPASQGLSGASQSQNPPPLSTSPGMGCYPDLRSS